MRLLITAGPTREPIDPVRYLSNRSSGKMGYALAEAALARGAQVTLVSGPVALTAPADAQVIRVQSAADMHRAVMENLGCSTMVIMAAAVADYRPATIVDQKMKKNGDRMVLELEQTVDILATVGHTKGTQIVIGFAAETENILENARKKLVTKRADLIVANDVSAQDAGFDVDTNRITLVSDSETTELPLLTKREAADRILDSAITIKASRTSTVS